MARPTDLVHSILNLFKILSLEERRGGAIDKRIRHVAPALRELEQQAWMKTDWRLLHVGRTVNFALAIPTAANIVMQDAWQ